MYENCDSVAEPHHFYEAPTPGKDHSAAPAAALIRYIAS
jgi:hypothetical protein